jgi:peptidoglycan hydrolase-like protein with peptidoglycan-binding domain
MKYQELIKLDSNNQEAVKAIKNQLNIRINAGLNVDNPSFGETTQKAVIAFQKANNLNPDGVIGELTWERLFNEVVPEYVSSATLRIRAEQILFKQLHVREKTNKNDGVDVEAYLKEVGLSKGYAWCMAFVYWGFQKAATQLGFVNLVPKTAGVLDCYSKARSYKVNEPAKGDQFIMDFGGGKGHTGIVTSVKNGRVYTIEGNTSADPTFAGEDREGNGVFERNRQISSIKAFLRYE